MTKEGNACLPHQAYTKTPTNSCPSSRIRDALSVAEFGLISDMLMCIFSSTVVKLFYGKIVVILILPIKIMPDTKYEFYGYFVLGTERETTHLVSLSASLQLSSSQLKGISEKSGGKDNFHRVECE